MRSSPSGPKRTFGKPGSCNGVSRCICVHPKQNPQACRPDEGQNLSITVHTLDARNNVMLEVIRDRFKLSPDVMHRKIQGVARATSALLRKKGIDYGALRSALVP